MQNDPNISSSFTPSPPPQTKLMPHKRLAAWYKRQMHATKIGMGCGIFIVVLSMCICTTAAVANVSPTPQTTAAVATPVPTKTSATPTPTPTPAPTPKPTPTSTPAPTPTPVPTPIPTLKPTPSSPAYTHATHGPTVLGVSVSNFFGKYGNYSNIPLNRGYTWSVDDQDGNPSQGVDASIHTDGTVYRVDVINLTDTNWSIAQSTQTCSAFLPAGSSFEEQVTDQITRYNSPAGEIQLDRMNDYGDCILQFSNTIGANN
ncbi:hypothetical protein [Dictyobacter halimunensis]|uniref:hypothetical protein n=1 Tax=Dictyobacter halimunensis TaxID=3026934 RepID=UPI0030C6ADC4